MAAVGTSLCIHIEMGWQILAVRTRDIDLRNRMDSINSADFLWRCCAALIAAFAWIVGFRCPDARRETWRLRSNHLANHKSSRRHSAVSTVVPATICACVNTRRASRAVCHLYDLVLRPTGLKVTQFVILQRVAEAGVIAHSQLAKDLGASVETLSRRLANARKKGLVNMREGKDHRKLYSLTLKGTTVLERAIPYWTAAQLRLQRSMGEQEWQQFMALMRRLTIAATRAESIRIANAYRQPSEADPDRRTAIAATESLRTLTPRM